VWAEFVVATRLEVQTESRELLKLVYQDRDARFSRERRTSCETCKPTPSGLNSVRFVGYSNVKSLEAKRRRQKMAQIGRILVMAALLGLLALTPTRTSAATLVPFQASVFEHFSEGFCAPQTVCITAAGTGQATSGQASHLGKVTEDFSVQVDVNPADVVNGCSPETRSTVLVAANGDEITMSATGWSCFATSSASDSYVVTGGTGRFQGAFGSGTDSNTFMLTSSDSGVAVTTFSGNLSSPGSLASSR
jgi:hypothetical protein